MGHAAVRKTGTYTVSRLHMIDVSWNSTLLIRYLVHSSFGRYYLRLLADDIRSKQYSKVLNSVEMAINWRFSTKKWFVFI